MILLRDTNEYMVKLNTEIKVYRGGHATLQGDFPKSDLKNITFYIPNNISRYIGRLSICENLWYQRTGSSRYVYNGRDETINLNTTVIHKFIPIRFYSTSKSTLSKLKLMT